MIRGLELAYSALAPPIAVSVAPRELAVLSQSLAFRGNLRLLFGKGLTSGLFLGLRRAGFGFGGKFGAFRRELGTFFRVFHGHGETRPAVYVRVDSDHQSVGVFGEQDFFGDFRIRLVTGAELQRHAAFASRFCDPRETMAKLVKSKTNDMYIHPCVRVQLTRSHDCYE